MNRRPSTPPATRVSFLLASIALATTALCGCSGPGADAPGPSPVAASATELEHQRAESGVPEACLGAYPLAVGSADLADVDLLPADWPTDAVEGTLCQTTSTPDGSRESADYASDVPPAAVLDQFEGAFPASYAVTRTQGAFGTQLDGRAGHVYFTLTARDGQYGVTLGTD